MPVRRRRLATAASALITCATLLLAGCGGNANGRGSTDPSATAPSTPSSTSASTTATPTDTSTSPTDSPTTPSPYTIDCHLIKQSHVDQWTKGGEPAAVEATDNGCRVVSSDPEGALMIQWRFLDAASSGSDAGLIDEINKTGDAVSLTDDITAVRSETDVEPTRKTRLYVTFDNERTLYVEATATLDRPRTMADLREITTTILLAYSDQPALPTPPPATTTSSSSSESTG